jgi:hypothetical protein
MEKRILLKAVMFGVALAALVSARPVLGQFCGEEEVCSHCPDTPPPCDFDECPPLPPCEEVIFSCTTYPCKATQTFPFDANKIKITVNIEKRFTLAIQFVPIDNTELGLRLNSVLGAQGPTNCIPYDGAAFNGDLNGSCGFYHVVEPLPVKDVDYSGDVLYKVFWNFPDLDLPLHNIRLYRAPIPTEGDPEDCSGGAGFDGNFCFTQDITGAVYPFGNTGTDPGVSGKKGGFSDYEVVDLTSPTSPAARVWIGLKDNSGSLVRVDLRAEVKNNSSIVSEGELLGALGGGPGFGNANLLTIPLSLPASPFAPGSVSMELFVRSSCLGSSPNSGTARLWFNDAKANSRVDESGVPTLYLVMPGSTLNLSSSAGKGKKTRDAFVDAPVSSCDGPYKSLGKWSGMVP